jgi:hypothetical protein
VAACYNSSQIVVELAATRRRRWSSTLRICTLGFASLACLLGVVSTSANAGPSSGSASGNYLVVWAEERGRSTDIYGARVSAEGNVLDRRGIPISTAKHDQAHPSVAFDGTDYLVVWTDDRSKVGDSFERSDVYGARVTEAGVVLDRAGIPISTARSYQGGPIVAFDGSNFLVVWDDWRSASPSTARTTWSPGRSSARPGSPSGESASSEHASASQALVSIEPRS